MKPIPILFAVATLIFAASCSSTKNTASIPDDVYYSAGDHQEQSQPAAAVSQASPSNYSQENNNYNPDQNSNYTQDYSGTPSQSPASTQQYSDDKGNTYVTNNYYNDDDYYDYEYSARLKRYYTPASGYGYYDPFYTNSYWYDYNPYNYGVSIYLGYNWWAPSYCYYDPFWYGPVYPYHHFYGYYDSWNSPYGYYGYNNYWNGYNHGYQNGYWDGYYNGVYASTYNNPYYYNSYDGTSTYYGPRGSISSNGKTTSASPRASLGEKYQRAVDQQKIPMMDSQGISGTHVGVNPGGGRNNISGPAQGNGKQNVIPANPKNETVGGINPVKTEPTRGPISVKNETGGKNNVIEQPKVDPSSYSTPGRSNSGISQNPKDNGGSVRPTIEQPTRGNINYSRPKNGDVSVDPRTNIGGPVRPNVEQPRNSQYVRPGNVQPRNNNIDNNSVGQPRNENANPLDGGPRIDQHNERPRNNPSYERPRQEIQPRIEPRQEPRLYKQENAQPRQKENISTPSPRQQNYSSPAPRNNSSGENKGGGRRK